MITEIGFYTFATGISTTRLSWVVSEDFYNEFVGTLLE